AQKLGFDADRAEKTALMFRNAPLMVAVVESPVDSDKVPYFEQTLSAGAVCQSLLTAALASGWGANWLSGPLAIDADFGAKALSLRSEERVAGFIVLGTETTPPPERPRPDLSKKVTWLT
ncbi:MAG: nitroreductase family protein, partial [Pseudomonadota bacterium]